MEKYKNEKFESLKHLFPHRVENLSEAKEYASGVFKTVENGVRSAGKVKNVERALRDVGVGAISGVVGEKLSEFYERVVSYAPGGRIVIDQGLPSAVRRIIYSYPTTHINKIVTENIDNARSNAVFWGVVGVTAFELACLGVKYSYDWYKERKQKENTEEQ